MATFLDSRIQVCTSRISSQWDTWYTSQLMDLDRKPTEALSTNPFSLSKGFQSCSMRYIVGASSMGTIIESYDIYIFGSLAQILAEKLAPSAHLANSRIQYPGL